MQNQKDQTHDENGQPMNPFSEMLKIMDVEHLIRFRQRLKKVGRKRMVEILSEEIETREELERKEVKMRQAALAEDRKTLRGRASQ